MVHLETEQERLEAEIRTTSTVDPEFILWSSSGYSKASRFRRRLVSFLIFIILTLSTSSITILFNNYRYDSEEELPSLYCTKL